jgi:hypothetical protein
MKKLKISPLILFLFITSCRSNIFYDSSKTLKLEECENKESELESSKCSDRANKSLQHQNMLREESFGK